MRWLRLLPVGEPAPGDLIDPLEAAAILGVSRSTIYNAVKDGRLTPHIREFDGRLQVSRAEVLRAARYRPQKRREQASNGGAA